MSTGTIHDGYFDSHDGLALYYRERLIPDARAHIVLVHGVCEHYGRYRDFEAYFTDRGIGFSMMDLRGHGQSEGRRIHVSRFSDYVDDLDLLVDHVRGHAKDIFLVGHSLGGVIAIRYVQTRKPDFRGLITSAAGVRPSVTPPAPVFAALRQINRLYSGTPVPGLIRPEQICRDAAIVQRYKSDPLVPKYTTTGFGLEMLAAGDSALDDAENIELPVLLMHGGADQVAYPSGTKQLYRRVASKDKSMKLYPGLYHELFNEPEREEVLEDVHGWINKRVGS